MEEQSFQRQTAIKIRIEDILSSNYKKNDGFNPNYVELNNKKISRVNVIGVLLEKYGFDKQKRLLVDDGTGRLSIRSFEGLENFDEFNVGDVVMIVGRPREFSEEKYVLVEIIKKINPLWAKVRSMELGSAKKEKIDEPILDEEVVESNPKDKIIKLIKKFDSGNGASIEDVSLEEGSDRLVETLLKEGEVFEVKPGKLKVLE
ncbi:hypothetical protein ISS07_01330 [Candidatus Woesearchaeota archaeon]|nr:hypothetical protein [Candidatus Woesearchaeota archaeon]